MIDTRRQNAETKSTYSFYLSKELMNQLKGLIEEGHYVNQSHAIERAIRVLIAVYHSGGKEGH